MDPEWVRNHTNGIPQLISAVAGDTINGCDVDCTTMRNSSGTVTTEEQQTAVVKFHKLDLGYTPFIVALGITMNARAIIMRNNRSHIPALGNLPSSIIVKLIELLDDKHDENLRREIHENGLNLLVRYNHLHDLQGTPFCNAIKEREYAIIKSFYSRDGNCHKINSKVPLAVDKSEYDHPQEMPILQALHLMRPRRQCTISLEERLDTGARALLPPTYRFVSVPRDGHCMFRALAICLSHLATDHHTIRKTIINHVLCNWGNLVVPYGEWIQHEHPNETPVTYKHRMLGRSQDWGDHPELVAATEHYGHHIVVFEYAQDIASFREVVVLIPGVELQNAPRIMLIRVGHNHYHAGNCTIRTFHNYLHMFQTVVRNFSYCSEQL